MQFIDTRKRSRNLSTTTMQHGKCRFPGAVAILAPLALDRAGTGHAQQEGPGVSRISLARS